MKRILHVIILLFAINFGYSQELKCRISVNHSQVQGTNVQVFQTLQKDLYEFMNNRRWTNNVFSVNERIDCQIMINIAEYNGIDKFTGTISVQSNRPVYNTNYKSILLNHKEKDKQFQFEYVDGQTLEFSENTHISNLTSVLSFYAYIIIGLDYDSFGVNSGSVYFQKAQQIVNNAQSATEPGWKAYESNDRTNRYYLIENILSSTNSPIRLFYYRYHRKGLDKMSDKTQIGRNEITKSIEMLRKVYRKQPDSYFLKILMNTKLSEIAKVYSEAPLQEKTKVYNILKEIDPVSKKVDAIMSKSK